jgi:hypothetical protein
MTYVIERDSLSGRRYVGIYRAAGGTYKCAGTYSSHERAYEDEHRRSECERLRPGLQAVSAAVSRTTAPASADHVSVTMPSAPAFETAAASRGIAAMGAWDDWSFNPEHLAYRRAHCLRFLRDLLATR